VNAAFTTEEIMKKPFVCNLSAFAMSMLVLPLLALSGQSGNGAQTFTGEVMDSICTPDGSHAATMAKMSNMGKDSETCTNECVAMGAKYMLYDQTSHTVYSVNRQDKLARFAGHKVRITGTLDGNKINVADINGLG
jgi:hypothetical protein